MTQIQPVTPILNSVNYELVTLRERFTNILVRIATHVSQPQQETTHTWNNEYDDLRSEAAQILKEHPEWQDIANHWLPKDFTT